MKTNDMEILGNKQRKDFATKEDFNKAVFEYGIWRYPHARSNPEDFLAAVEELTDSYDDPRSMVGDHAWGAWMSM